MVAKIKRDAFLYLEPSKKQADFAQCGSCCLFDGKTCALFPAADNAVDAEDSCGFYIPGDGEGMPDLDSGTVTKKDAGFVSREVRCENCAYLKDGSGCDLYYQLNEALPKLFNLDTEVEPEGCCNAQTLSGSVKALVALFAAGMGKG